MKAALRPEHDAAEPLRRVLSSSGFRRNERMSRFLRFLVERHLEGRDDELKESVIAVEVFGRKPDYDPKLDSIVRTEAGRLRARLAEFYAGEGRSDPIVIDLPKGGYIASLRERAVSGERRTTGSTRRWLQSAVVGCALALTATVWWSFRSSDAPIRIAVLPLENRSPDGSGGDFADGLTDEIIRNLSMIEGLAVRSQTSSFALKGRPREAGAQLGVDYLVQGSVLRAGDQLRIEAQVNRVRDDDTIWSGRFDRQLRDVFAIEDEIALGIVNNLRLQLGRGRRRYETSIEAYDLYLKGRAKSFGFAGPLRPDGAAGMAAFEQAIAVDPAFAPAYAGLASLYAVQSAQFAPAHAPDELAKMRSTAEKAIQLDPLLAEAHAALALADARDAQWERAEQRFRHAIDLDRNRSRTFIDFAMWVLAVVGRNDEALQQLRIAQTTDPLSSEVHATIASLLMSSGRFDEAGAQCVKMSADDSLKTQCLGRVRLGQGHAAEAAAIFAQDPDLGRNPQARGFLGNAYARSSRGGEAEQMAQHSVYPNEQALIYAGFGDKDRTLDALERMRAVTGAQRIGRYLGYPEMAFLRGDPRLQQLRKRIGLPM